MVKGNTEISDGAGEGAKGDASSGSVSRERDFFGRKRKDAIRKKLSDAVDVQKEMPVMAGVNLVKAEKVKRRRLSFKEHKAFAIVLSLMGVVIVGLTVAIVVVNVVKNGEGELVNEEVSEEILDVEGETCNGEGEGSENKEKRIDGEVKAIAEEAEAMKYEDAISFIDKKIEENKDSDYEFGMRMIKVYLLLNNGFASEAWDELQQFDSTIAWSNRALEYYVVMAKVARALGEDGEAEQYDNLYAALYQELYGEDFTDE